MSVWRAQDGRQPTHHHVRRSPPLTGAWMVHVAGLPWDAPWLAWSIGLYVLAVACWLPVVWLQMRMRDLARHAAATQSRVPSAHQVQPLIDHRLVCGAVE